MQTEKWGRKKRFTWFVVLLFCMVWLAGCSLGNKSGSERNLADDELIVSLASEPDDGFDPTKGWGQSHGSPLFQSTLLKRDNDLNIVNDLATGYTTSADGLVWTFKLRNDVKFTDGLPLTAADVVYTFETTANSGSTADLQILNQVTAVDPYTVQFTLKQPRSAFISTIMKIGIVPKHAHNQDYARQPIGSGPYKFVQWDRGQQLIVEANPDYYGAKPYFRKITFVYLSEEASFAAAKSGQVDIALVNPQLAKQSIPGMQLVQVTTVDNRGIMFPYLPSGTVTKDGLPIGNDVTSDIAIRKAINIAIDRKALIAGVLDGFGSPAYTVNDRLPWWNPDTVIADGDSEEARRILAAAGWHDSNNDGILDKNGVEAQFTLILPPGDRVRQSLAIAVSDMIRPLGIRIETAIKSWDEIGKLMHSHAVLFGFGAHDPLEMYNLYSSHTQGIEYNNAGYYTNASVDSYMDRALAAASEQEALNYWKQAQWDGQTGLSARGDAPWAWLVNVDHLYFVREGLDIGQQRIHPHGSGWPLTDNIEEWKWAGAK